MSMQELLKQAQMMQAKLADAQAKVEGLEAEGVSGAGLVRVTLAGKGALKRIKIDPSLLVPADVEILEDLIAAAHSDAKAKLDQTMGAEMQKMTSGLNLPPGFKLPF
ncbi:MAG: YbaB/EbfC family nucleoid-associated protein [Alphaproteobacteria bacterium]|nr:YbaB/EbfC family nucleoid-associated protein [Alphaproteobacteria bacterium]